MKDIVKPEKYYTVTFDVDGEKESVSVKEGEKASEKEAPQKEGYTFLGWYLEDQKYDFETPVSTDITLCANGRRTKHQPRIRFRTLIQSQNQSQNQSRIRSRHLQKPFRLRRS